MLIGAFHRPFTKGQVICSSGSDTGPMRANHRCHVHIFSLLIVADLGEFRSMQALSDLVMFASKLSSKAEIVNGTRAIMS